jgi:ribonuclease-3
VNDDERVALLTARLGLPETSLHPALALQALRHGSYVHERQLSAAREQLRSNERLEFLGDAVLGFLVAQRVFDRFPGAPEGELTRLRASVVREEALALAARQLGLGELLLLGRGEERGGGRENAARLADALEAVLGAVFLCCGMERAQEVIERVLAPLFEQTDPLAHDPKTELQQLFQARRRVPHYQVLAVNGPDHARSYDVEVRLDETRLGRGEGRSKKEAEQAAARVALANPDLLAQALAPAIPETQTQTQTPTQTQTQPDPKPET